MSFNGVPIEVLQAQWAAMDALKDGGMTHEEAFEAMELAKAEGRSVGTVEEEMARAAADAQVPIEVNIPMVEEGFRNILLIQGVSQVDDWMTTYITGDGEMPSPGMRPLTSSIAKAVQTFHLRWTRVDFHSGRQNNAKACLSALDSGAFHGVIVCDLSHHFEDFQASLGKSLRDFSHAGGCVAFSTSEGLQLAPFLGQMFGTEWKAGGYDRQTWQRSRDNKQIVDVNFSTNSVASYSAKAASLKNVPTNECMYVSEGGSANNTMFGRTVGVAVHDIGSAGGSIAYFGDVNMEEATALLLLSYVSRRCIGSLAASNDKNAWFIEAMSKKQSGNLAFGKRQFVKALDHYKVAVSIFQSQQTHALGEEKLQLLNIRSNMAEACLRLSKWQEANIQATYALQIDETHIKSLLRRAKAFIGMEQDESAHTDLGNLFVQMCLKDIQKPNLVAEKLFHEVEGRMIPWRESMVQSLATELGWQQEASQDPSLLRFTRASTQELVHVWFTTGTVGTYVTHPTQGKTQLFRREMTFGDLRRIFLNPRIHTGSGYHQKQQQQLNSSNNGKGGLFGAPRNEKFGSSKSSKKSSSSSSTPEPVIPEPTIVEGYEYHNKEFLDTISNNDSERFAYIGKDEDTRIPQFVDYGPIEVRNARDARHARDVAEIQLEQQQQQHHHHHHQQQQRTFPPPATFENFITRLGCPPIAVLCSMLVHKTMEGISEIVTPANIAQYKKMQEEGRYYYPPATSTNGMRHCFLCQEEHQKTSFSNTQWSKRNKSPGRIKCKACLQLYKQVMSGNF